MWKVKANIYCTLLYKKYIIFLPKPQVAYPKEKERKTAARQVEVRWDKTLCT